MKKPDLHLTLVVTLLLVVMAATTGDASEKWGPFRGQLVDQATGKGIPGAAIIAIWWKNEPNPIQMNRSFFDATEAVTDAEGRFEIPRYAKPPFFDFQIYPAEVIYFAPAYLPVREEMIPPTGQPFIATTVIYMRRIESLEELRRRSRAWPGRVPSSKMRLRIQAVNVERSMLGMDPLPTINDEREQP